MTAEQLPSPPSHLVADDDHWCEWTSDVWRVHQNSPGRPAWNEARHFGPVDTMRFDPQEPPPTPGRPEGVQYVAGNALAAFGETFQSTKLIPVHDPSLILVRWAPARSLRLLDVRRDFGAANGATASFSAWPDKARVREWARAAYLRWPYMDGLLYSSKVTGWDSIALFTREDTEQLWPARPAFSRSLNDVALRPFIQGIADKLRWGLDFGA